MWFRRRQPLILLADNDDDYREGLRVALEDDGYRVKTVSNPRDARKEFDRERPALALVDIRLVSDEDPYDESGVRLTREFAESVPVIVITVHNRMAPIVGLFQEEPKPEAVLHKREDGRDKILGAVADALAASTGRRRWLWYAVFVLGIGLVGWLIDGLWGENHLLSYGISLATGIAILLLDNLRRRSG